MDGVNVPFLPTGLWLLAAALALTVIIIWFTYDVFNRRRVKAFLKDSEDLSHLAAEKQIRQAEVDALRHWIYDQKAELERLTAEREDQERLRAQLADLEQSCAKKDQENLSLRNEVGELENQRHNLSQVLEKLEREIGDLDAKRAEAKAIDENLADLRTRLEEAREALHDLAGMQAKLIALSAEKSSMERMLKELGIEAESATIAVEQHRKMAEQARTEAEEAKGNLADARKERAQLDVILDTLRHEQNALKLKVGSQEQRIDELKASAKTATEEAKQYTIFAKEAREEAEKADRKLENILRDRQRLEIELSELNARKTVLEQELMRLDGNLGAKPGEDEDPLAAYADLLETPLACLDKSAFGNERDKQDENTILQQLKTTLREEGLIFSSRVIDAFHTSLKCHDINPVTVLAGVSGTGKTLLPMKYAEIMGMHRLVMAVQPRWDSPQDMFGFYNYLEKKYKATELSRSLVRMDPYNFKSAEFSSLDRDWAWAKERLLLVLLDEMNLARTEYYFSEFLSKLELRREVKDPSKSHKRSQAEVELDAGPGKHRFRLWVGHNVFFVGTLNEDETTQTLSDKVLDRANVIRFGKPDEKAKAAKGNTVAQTASNNYLSFSLWRSWHRYLDEGAAWYEQVSGWTKRLNAAMDRVGRPFGFRVQQAIGQYVANYPRVEDAERYRLAFADQVEQKIIPKLRGIDLGNGNANECLSELETIIDELDDSELSGAFDAARTESKDLGMFQWRGVTRRVEEGND